MWKSDGDFSVRLFDLLHCFLNSITLSLDLRSIESFNLPAFLFLLSPLPLSAL